MTPSINTSRQDARPAVYAGVHEDAPTPEETSTVRTLARVCGEFINAPRLRLTVKRAQTLWGLDESACTRVLSLLVDAKFLCRFGDEYGRTINAPAFVTVSRSKLGRGTDQSAGAVAAGRRRASRWRI